MRNSNTNFKNFVKNNFKGGNLYTFIGSGGKSSSILVIGNILSDFGYRIRIGTTTKISTNEFPGYFLKITRKLENFTEVINLSIKKILIVSGYWKIKEKYFGFPKNWWDNLIIPNDTIILIEGDGSKRKPIKLPKSYEPVIPKITARVFLLIGLSVLNSNINSLNTYNIKKVKSYATRDLSYNTSFLFKIIIVGWKKIYTKYNTSILFNQCDLIKDKKNINKLSKDLYKNFCLENHIMSIKKNIIYKSNQLFVRGIILAAGKSSRMGKPKGLLKIGEKTFLQKSICLLNRVVKELTIGLGFKKNILLNHLKNESCKTLIIKKYQEGMGATLKQLIKNLEKGDGFFIHLCDLPNVQIKVIDMIYKDIFKNKDKIIIPTYKGKQGHPIYFPESAKIFFKDLKNSEGGKNILKNIKILKINVNCSGIVQDIDTLEEYKNIERDKI